MQTNTVWAYRANVVEVVNNSKLPFDKKAKRLSKILSVLPPFETEEGKNLLNSLENANSVATFERELDVVYNYCDYFRICLS